MHALVNTTTATDPTASLSTMGPSVYLGFKGVGRSVIQSYGLRTVQRVITVYHAARDDKSHTNLGVLCGPKSSTTQGTHSVENKKLSCHRGTARCVVLVEILATATQQCRNYLFDKS